MAILKHVAGKSADYGAALDYLKYEHDEVLKKPLLDANGNWVLRRDILLDGINCEPELFDLLDLENSDLFIHLPPFLLSDSVHPVCTTPVPAP